MNKMAGEQGPGELVGMAEGVAEGGSSGAGPGTSEAEHAEGAAVREGEFHKETGEHCEARAEVSPARPPATPTAPKQRVTSCSVEKIL
jgi:hypothetical protein